MSFTFNDPIEPIDETHMYLQIIQEHSSAFFDLTHMVNLAYREPVSTNQHPSVLLTLSGGDDPYQIYEGPVSPEIFEFIIQARLKNKRYLCIDLRIGKMKYWSAEQVIRSLSIPYIRTDTSFTMASDQ